MINVSKSERNAVIKAFPLIEQIGNATLKDGVIRTIVRAWRESGYRKLDEIPNSSGTLAWDVTWVEHTNSTTKAALALAQLYSESYGINVNLDFLIAAATLHDVDKMLIDEKKGNLIEKSALGKMIPHGAYGAHLAIEEGLPVEVAHVLATHSPNSGTYPTTVEGALIQYSDLAELEVWRLSHGKSRVTRPVMI